MRINIFTTLSDPENKQYFWKEALENYLDFADEVIVVDGMNYKGKCQDFSLHDQDHDKKHDREETASEIRYLLYEDLVIKTHKDDAYDKLKIINYPWPEEFDWKFIGEQMQRGYDACTGSWCLRLDADYLIHEDDFQAIRDFLEHCDKPIARFAKKQFLLADRYRVKSLLPIAFNKGKFGDRIKLNGGGDLCQPTIDGREPRGNEVAPIYRPKILIAMDDDTKEVQKRMPDIFVKNGITYQMVESIPIWNYECLLRTKEVEAKEFHRFAKAWKRTFKEDHLGATSEKTALKSFMDMQLGRFKNQTWKKIPLSHHPKVIQETIKNLNKNQFGYSLWENAEPASYFKEHK